MFPEVYAGHLRHLLKYECQHYRSCESGSQCRLTSSEKAASSKWTMDSTSSNWTDTVFSPTSWSAVNENMHRPIYITTVKLLWALHVYDIFFTKEHTRAMFLCTNVFKNAQLLLLFYFLSSFPLFIITSFLLFLFHHFYSFAFYLSSFLPSLLFFLCSFIPSVNLRFICSFVDLPSLPVRPLELGIC